MVCCVWEPPPGNSSHGNNLKQFLLGQANGDKASYSPSPCFHLPNSSPCSRGPRIHGEHLRQEPQAVLFVRLVHNDKVYPHHSSCHWWVATKDDPKNMEESVETICCGLPCSPTLHIMLCCLPTWSCKGGLLCAALFCAIPNTSLWDNGDPICRIGRVFVENSCTGTYCEILDVKVICYTLCAQTSLTSFLQLETLSIYKRKHTN